MTDSYFNIIQDLKEGKIKVRQAEKMLRGSFGAGLSASNYQQIYNYLDELAGVLDGKEETAEQLKRFFDFLNSIGFSETF